MLPIGTFLFAFLVTLYFKNLDKETEGYITEFDESLDNSTSLPDYENEPAENIIVTSDSNYSRAIATFKSLTGKTLGKPKKIIPLKKESIIERKKEIIKDRTRNIPGIIILPKNLREGIRDYYRYLFTLENRFEEEICEYFKEKFEKHETLANKIRGVDNPTRYDELVFYEPPESKRSLLKEVFLPLLKGVNNHHIELITDPREKDKEIENCRNILMDIFFGLYSKKIVGTFIYRELNKNECISKIRDDVKNEDRYGYWFLPCEDCNENEFRMFRYVGVKTDQILNEYWTEKYYYKLHPKAETISQIEFVDTPFLSFKKKDKDIFKKGPKAVHKKGEMKFRKRY